MGARICVTSIVHTPAEYRSGRAGGQTSDEAFVNTPAGTLGPTAVAHGTQHTRSQQLRHSQNLIYFTRSQFIPQMQLKK
jgi:hypothetical protein